MPTLDTPLPLVLHYAPAQGPARWRRVWLTDVRASTRGDDATPRLLLDGRDAAGRPSYGWAADRVIQAVHGADGVTADFRNLARLAFEEATIADAALRVAATTARTAEHGLVFDAWGCIAGWRFALPRAFTQALDLEWTAYQTGAGTERVWTQGVPATFAFDTGDTIYDARRARCLTWGNALGLLTTIVEVMDARADSALPGRRKQHGHVRIAVTPVRGGILGRPVVTEMRQADLVARLRDGFEDDWDERHRPATSTAV